LQAWTVPQAQSNALRNPCYTLLHPIEIKNALLCSGWKRFDFSRLCLRQAGAASSEATILGPEAQRRSSMAALVASSGFLARMPQIGTDPSPLVSNAMEIETARH
jgi:hypothetical protein